MEPLWSPVVATGGNQRQIGRGRKRRKQAKTVAVLCDRLPREVGVRDERPGDAAVRRARRASTNAPPAAAALAGLTIKKCDPENWSIALRIAFDLTM